MYVNYIHSCAERNFGRSNCSRQVGLLQLLGWKGVWCVVVLFTRDLGRLHPSHAVCVGLEYAASGCLGDHPDEICDQV